MAGRIHSCTGISCGGLIGLYSHGCRILRPDCSAISFTVLLFPIYKWLNARLWKNRPLASLLCVLIFLFILLIPATILIWQIIKQIALTYAKIQPYLEGLITRGSESRIGQWFINSPLGNLFEIKQLNWMAVLENVFQTTASWGSQIARKTSESFFGTIVDLIIILFTMFYLFLDGERLIRTFRFLTPLRPEYKKIIFSRFSGVSSATIKGTIIIGLIQGIIGALTLLIFGIKSWLLWGIVMVVIAVIPLIGPPIILIPAGIVKLIGGEIWQGIGILLMSFLVVSSVDNFLRPRLVGHEAHVHDLLIFFSTLGGLGLFGIWGFIIGPALAGLTMAALEIFRRSMNPVLERFTEKGWNENHSSAETQSSTEVSK